MGDPCGPEHVRQRTERNQQLNKFEQQVCHGLDLHHCISTHGHMSSGIDACLKLSASQACHKMMGSMLCHITKSGEAGRATSSSACVCLHSCAHTKMHIHIYTHTGTR